jgi:hypothetical protein
MSMVNADNDSSFFASPDTEQAAPASDIENEDDESYEGSIVTRTSPASSDTAEKPKKTKTWSNKNQIPWEFKVSFDTKAEVDKWRHVNGFTKWLAKDKSTTDTVSSVRYGCGMHTEDGKMDSLGCPALSKIRHLLSGKFEIYVAKKHEGVPASTKRGIAFELKEECHKLVEAGGRPSKIINCFESEGGVARNRVPDSQQLANLRKSIAAQEKKTFFIEDNKGLWKFFNDNLVRVIFITIVQIITLTHILLL